MLQINRINNRALLSATALTGLFAAGMFSPMSVQEAAAACSLTGTNIYLCTGASPSPDPFDPTADGFIASVGSFVSPPTPAVEVPGQVTVDSLIVNAAHF